MSDNGIDWDKHAEEALKFTPISRDKNNPFFQLKHEGGLILDAGCSIGRWRQILEDAGYKYVGVDQSRKALQLAKKLCPNVDFVRCAIQKLPFQQCFDTVISIAMLQHQNHDTKRLMLNQFKQVLKQKGNLIISEATYKDKPDNWTDGRGFNVNGWINFITQQGFQLVNYIEPYYHFRKALNC
jgi:SAM-dependent methyltransferase